MHGPLTVGSFCSPILTALAAYRGQVVDLDEGGTVSADELRSGADAVATWLTGHGLEPADRVVFSIGNGPAFPAAFCGVLMAGGCPLLLHGETPPDELRRFAQQYAARYIVSQRAGGDDLAYAPWLKLSSIEVRLEWEAPPFPRLVSTPLHPTSGTTGCAKVAVRTAHQAAAEAIHYIDTMRISFDDRILCAVPMSHAYGFGVGLMVSLVSGATLLTMRQFNPRAIARALAEQQITVFPAVPAMLSLIVQALGCEVPMPRLVLTAGAPLAEATGAAFRRRTGAGVTPLYGTTETGGIAVAVGDSGDLPTGCVGPPMGGVEARILAIDGAAELAPGVGRVAIRSSSMMSGYLTPQGVDAAMIRDGWFETGDLGRIDADGHIHLVGRETEIINVFGMKVVPSEVEEVIGAMPGVREVQVYAGRHHSGSDIIKVALAANGAVDVAAVRSYCETQLAPYKRPQVIHLVASLPRSPLGKILRDRLP